MHLTSTEIFSAAKIVGEEKALEMIGKAGFQAWDFSLFNLCRYDYAKKQAYHPDHPLSSPGYAEFAKRLRRIGEEYGMVCNQSHAPFPVACPEIRSSLKRAIECTAIAGGKICVIHPDNYKTPEENAELFLWLLPFAKEHGVKIATENMWNWNADRTASTFAACSTSESFLAHLDAVNDEDFVACLDIGHAEMQGSGSGAVNMIHALGNRLQALHLHDNDLLLDRHRLPKEMDIDFLGVMRALRYVKYQGDFTLEADQYLKDYDADSLQEGIDEMAYVARKLAEIFRFSDES